MVKQENQKLYKIPINTIDDLKGKRSQAQQSPASAMANALCSSPHAHFGEVYTAIQQAH